MGNNYCPERYLDVPKTYWFIDANKRCTRWMHTNRRDEIVDSNVARCHLSTICHISAAPKRPSKQTRPPPQVKMLSKTYPCRRGNCHRRRRRGCRGPPSPWGRTGTSSTCFWLLAGCAFRCWRRWLFSKCPSRPSAWSICWWPAWRTCRRGRCSTT